MKADNIGSIASSIVHVSKSGGKEERMCMSIDLNSLLDQMKDIYTRNPSRK